jgi:hypothetical protein
MLVERGLPEEAMKPGSVIEITVGTVELKASIHPPDVEAKRLHMDDKDRAALAGKSICVRLDCALDAADVQASLREAALIAYQCNGVFIIPLGSIG